MRKLFFIVFLTIISGCLFTGCSNKRNSNLSLGNYLLEESEEVMKPKVSIQEDNKFIFVYSPYSSYIAYGSYIVDKDELILKTDDGKYEYIFKIKKGTLIFDSENSSEISSFSKVKDESVFKITKNGEQPNSLFKVKPKPNDDSNSDVQVEDISIPSKQLDNLKITKQKNGKVSIMSTDGISMKDVTTDEVWSKMNMQIFYIDMTTSTFEEYVIYRNDKLEHLPGPYQFDGGYAQFCVSDLDSDGEYELLSVFHAGSGINHNYLTCYTPKKQISGNFHTVFKNYILSKTDDQNVFLEFDTGEKGRVTLTKIGNKNSMVVIFPKDLSKEFNETIFKQE